MLRIGSTTLSPSVKGKLNYLPLANIFAEMIGRLCEMCPGIFLNPNDVMTFCGTFMTSSGENISTGDVVVHTVELDRVEGVVVQEGSSSTVQVELVLLFLLLNTSS